jgi:hypothetical protein
VPFRQQGNSQAQAVAPEGEQARRQKTRKLLLEGTIKAVGVPPHRLEPDKQAPQKKADQTECDQDRGKDPPEPCILQGRYPDSWGVLTLDRSPHNPSTSQGTTREVERLRTKRGVFLAAVVSRGDIG